MLSTVDVVLDDGRWLLGKTGLVWLVGEVLAERMEGLGEPP